MPEAETVRGRPRSISECFAVLTDVRTGNHKLHWILDVQFGEDGSRVRNADAAQNLNVIRKVAVDLLRRDRTTRHTFKKKRQIMTWKDEMLQHVIIGR